MGVLVGDLLEQSIEKSEAVLWFLALLIEDYLQSKERIVNIDKKHI